MFTFHMSVWDHPQQQTLSHNAETPRSKAIEKCKDVLASIQNGFQCGSGYCFNQSSTTDHGWCNMLLKFSRVDF